MISELNEFSIRFEVPGLVHELDKEMAAPVSAA